MAGGEIRFGEVIALAVLDRVGVLQALLDLAFAGAALLADRGAQQVRLFGKRHSLVVVGDESDGERHQSLTSAASSTPLPASCLSSARACLVEVRATLEGLNARLAAR